MNIVHNPVFFWQWRFSCHTLWWSPRGFQTATLLSKCICTGEAGTWRPVDQSTQWTASATWQKYIIHFSLTHKQKKKRGDVLVRTAVVYFKALFSLVTVGLGTYLFKCCWTWAWNFNMLGWFHFRQLCSYLCSNLTRNSISVFNFLKNVEKL